MSVWEKHTTLRSFVYKKMAPMERETWVDEWFFEEYEISK